MNKFSLSMSLIQLPLTRIFCSIWPNLNSFSISRATYPFSCILGTCFECVGLSVFSLPSLIILWNSLFIFSVSKVFTWSNLLALHKWNLLPCSIASYPCLKFDYKMYILFKKMYVFLGQIIYPIFRGHFSLFWFLITWLDWRTLCMCNLLKLHLLTHLATYWIFSDWFSLEACSTLSQTLFIAFIFMFLFFILRISINSYLIFLVFFIQCWTTLLRSVLATLISHILFKINE